MSFILLLSAFNFQKLITLNDHLTRALCSEFARRNNEPLVTVNLSVSRLYQNRQVYVFLHYFGVKLQRNPLQVWKRLRGGGGQAVYVRRLFRR